MKLLFSGLNIKPENDVLLDVMERFYVPYIEFTEAFFWIVHNKKENQDENINIKSQIILSASEKTNDEWTIGQNL